MADTPYAPSRIRALPSWLLGRAAARGHRLVAEALATEGMRMTHHAVLSAVAELGPVSQAELGRTVGIDPKDIVAIVNDLQNDGLVTRTPDPKDRRKNAIGISADGKRRLRRTERLGDAANAELTAALSDDERAQLIALLNRIVAPAE
ncbi:MarR family winged helix-turn-helix transcriptional regulator (plasmid) [Streptomyces sp. BHT-5-2]|uniref:MarR family winged helix-turn-helix transcriptional regulator n=1 Tax=Streptomyces sp. BHT-5-2 TaxID=2866715 RepID=UPI001C8DCC6E|nr:MarR family winged helix-turn-helix transcriptional regulator [Streptomyces sp. BHT-5-2]QZL08699.1 MarR family winged helix-turn-helix transcriptional regulator [Streptomyces sp. BHT-5-2]